MYKQDLVLNNLQGLITKKQPTILVLRTLVND